jgi:hypothetical protein
MLSKSIQKPSKAGQGLSFNAESFSNALIAWVNGPVVQYHACLLQHHGELLESATTWL